MRNSARSLSLLLVAAVLSLSVALPASAVSIDWVTIGDPGNAADDTGRGSVASVYRIGRTEVTNAQYAEFLNAVAKSDPNGLYDPEMGNPSTTQPFGEHAPGFGGITQSGSSGSFTYSTIAGRENLPVNHVGFYDTLRFANWLQNGQPTGAQGNATTEDGAYTITLSGIAANSITRNAGATHFLPSRDEWYKAAYYDAVSMSYFDFPAASDVPTICAAPSAAPNTANCSFAALGDLTAAGSYTGSASPSGTFDQGGNVSEFNEAIFGPSRGSQGGNYRNDPSALLATGGGPVNTSEQNFMGFRVAMVPEPGTGLLVMGGLLGLAGWRRRRA